MKKTNNEILKHQQLAYIPGLRKLPRGFDALALIRRMARGRLQRLVFADFVSARITFNPQQLRTFFSLISAVTYPR